ncbi:MAG: protein phosphatase [Pseudomonadota bacterium]
MADWTVSELALGAGCLGIAPVPGRSGNYEADLSALLRWGPALVLTMTGRAELDRVGAAGLGDDLGAAGVGWRPLPITDLGAPDAATAALWPAASAEAHGVLAGGGRVLAHCFGGCGRSGMALLRLMVEAGEDADPALARLRRARPCAVETEAQRAWAAIPMFERNGWHP